MVLGLAAYVNESTFTTFHSFLSFNNNLQKQFPIKPAPPVTNIVFINQTPPSILLNWIVFYLSHLARLLRHQAS